MSLIQQPSDFKFEVQGTKYFMRFEMDMDIGEAFIAAQFDEVSSIWDGFIFAGADQTAIDYYGGGTIEGLMQHLIDMVNGKLEEYHGTPPANGTLLEQEKYFLSHNVVLEGERLKLVL